MEQPLAATVLSSHMFQTVWQNFRRQKSSYRQSSISAVWIYCLKTFSVNFALNISYQNTFKEESYIRKKDYLSTYQQFFQVFLIYIESREHFTIELQQTDKGLTNHKTTSFWGLLKTSWPWKLKLQLTKCLRNFFFPLLFPLKQQILTLPSLQNRSCWTSEVGNMRCCARIWPTSQVGCFKLLNHFEQICFMFTIQTKEIQTFEIQFMYALLKFRLRTSEWTTYILWGLYNIYRLWAIFRSDLLLSW